MIEYGKVKGSAHQIHYLIIMADDFFPSPDEMNDTLVKCKALGMSDTELAPGEMRRKRIHNAIEDLKGSKLNLKLQ
jgi:hypothetical protein